MNEQSKHYISKIEWIPISEKLPPKAGKYLAVTGLMNAQHRPAVIELKFEITTIRGKEVRRWKYGWDRIADFPVYYWAIMPESPKESEG